MNATFEKNDNQEIIVTVLILQTFASLAAF